MGALSWIILGALAGWIAGSITKRNEGMDLVANIVVGLIGAFLGGFMANLVGRNPVLGFTFTGLLVAVFGTVVFLGVLSAVRQR